MTQVLSPTGRDLSKAGTSALRVASTLFVPTIEDTRLIQLCFGDIARLSQEDKVDVILISAFPNDYAATPGSLIGALNSVCQLSVKKLATNRLEDLRRNFHCWISHSLPGHLPFRQLVCYEKVTRDETTHDQAVNQVFRAMMPVFNNCNKSVITPLLATGCQGADEAVMLAAMIQAAVNWMRAGLPLRLLKIVIYARGEASAKLNEKLIKIFDGFRSQVKNLPRIPQIIAITYDVFLIHAKDDDELAKRIVESLNRCNEAAKKSVRVTSVGEVTTKETSWQYDVVSTMSACASVVALLTSSFMSDGKCIDQYNLAICADRRSQRSILAPIILDELSNLPVYMTSIQWFSCKTRDDDHIKDACLKIIDRNNNVVGKTNLTYDLFVSYSHKNVLKAKAIVQTLKSRCPDIRVFFDYDELRTGDKWQLSLYQALDASRCVVILLSMDYVNSDVCNEELNLALARHLSPESEMELIVLCIDATDNDLPLFQVINATQVVSLRGLEEQAEMLSSSVNQWLLNGTKDALFQVRQVSCDIVDLNNKLRESTSTLDCAVDPAGYLQTPSLTREFQPEPTAVDIFISFEARDQRYACFLAMELRRRGFSVVDQPDSQDLSSVDKARCVVVMLSAAFQQSTRKIDELNLSLTRRRSGLAVYVIGVELLKAPTPMYVLLTQCSVCLQDPVWEESLRSKGFKDFVAEIAGMRRITEAKHDKMAAGEVVALLKAAVDIADICSSPVSPPAQRRGCLQSIVDLCLKSGSVTTNQHHPKPPSESDAVGAAGDATPSSVEETRLQHKAVTFSPSVTDVNQSFSQTPSVTEVKVDAQLEDEAATSRLAADVIRVDPQVPDETPVQNHIDIPVEVSKEVDDEVIVVKTCQVDEINVEDRAALLVEIPAETLAEDEAPVRSLAETWVEVVEKVNICEEVKVEAHEANNSVVAAPESDSSKSDGGLLSDLSSIPFSMPDSDIENTQLEPNVSASDDGERAGRTSPLSVSSEGRTLSSSELMESLQGDLQTTGETKSLSVNDENGLNVKTEVKQQRTSGSPDGSTKSSKSYTCALL